MRLNVFNINRFYFRPHPHDFLAGQFYLYGRLPAVRQERLFVNAGVTVADNDGDNSNIFFFETDKLKRISFRGMV
jgi:hypothetical protein